MAYKTYENWEGSLHEYLQVGDIVDKAIVDHFVNVMPPATFTNSLIQLGEPYTHVNGRPVFPTIKKTHKGWMYCGNCFRGESESVYK